MAAKRLLMRQIRNILRLKWASGLANRAIARACGVGVGTVSGYLRRAEGAGLSWPLPEELDDGQLEALLQGGTSASLASRPQPDYAYLHRELKWPGVTLQLLWLEYLETHPGGYRYSQFCERYRRWARQLSPTMRQRHRAGEKTFIDFSGQKPEIVDPRTGEVHQVELFVAVLGASSLTYAEACPSQELPHWIETHIHMAEFFGGTSRIWIPDNLKSGVTRACRYEPGINRTYEDLAAHYGAVVIPARAAHPRDKAKVEAGVLMAQRWILARLRNRTFFSLAELNAAIWELLPELNQRVMKALGASRQTLFEELDRPALLPLPSSRYEIGLWKTATVNIDYHIEVEKNYYSVPYQLIHEEVEARYTTSTVEILHRSRRIASHPRLSGRGKCSTNPKHMPRSHRAHAEWTPSRILRWAAKSGPQTEALVQRILEERPHPEQGFRSCLGLFRLGKKYGPQRLETACHRALLLHSARYSTVKNILQTGVDRTPLPAEPETPPRSPHANIRGADYYQRKEIPC